MDEALACELIMCTDATVSIEQASANPPTQGDHGQDSSSGDPLDIPKCHQVEDDASKVIMLTAPKYAIRLWGIATAPNRRLRFR